MLLGRGNIEENVLSSHQSQAPRKTWHLATFNIVYKGLLEGLYKINDKCRKLMNTFDQSIEVSL